MGMSDARVAELLAEYGSSQACVADYAKTRFAAHTAPRQVHVVVALPKNPSGKIKRFELREQRRQELEPAQTTRYP